MGHGTAGIPTDRIGLPPGVNRRTIEGSIHIYAHSNHGGTVHPGRVRYDIWFDVISERFMAGRPIKAHALVDPKVLERIGAGRMRPATLSIKRGHDGIHITHVQVGSDRIPVMPI